MLRNIHLKSRPQMEFTEEKALEDALSFSEAGNHGVGAVGEGSNVERPIGRPQNPNDESLRGSIGKRMGVDENDSGNGGGGEAASEQIDDENPNGDEKDASGGVEREAVVSGEVSGDGGEARMGVDGSLLGRRGVEDKEGALGGVVEAEEGRYQFGEGEAGGEDHDAAARLLQQVADYVFVKLHHCTTFSGCRRWWMAAAERCWRENSAAAYFISKGLEIKKKLDA